MIRVARRVGVVAGVAVLAVCVAPGTAAADVIFDPADADELAGILAEAYEAQNVCYGWSVDVDNVGIMESSVGSNFGAGRSLRSSVDEGDCDDTVEFTATITWTSESSEQDDSASYGLLSSADAPTTADLDSLELVSAEGLVGDNVDVDVFKAVSALPLLAADAGIADPIEATPAAETAAGDAQPTNSPGSDFWRESGMQVLWGSLILVLGIVFGIYALRTSRRRSFRRWAPDGPGDAAVVHPLPAYEPPADVPAYVPEEWAAPKSSAEEPAEESVADSAGEPGEEPETPPDPEPEDDPSDPDPPEASPPDEPPRPKS